MKSLKSHPTAKVQAIIMSVKTKLSGAKSSYLNDIYSSNTQNNRMYDFIIKSQIVLYFYHCTFLLHRHILDAFYHINKEISKIVIIDQLNVLL